MSIQYGALMQIMGQNPSHNEEALCELIVHKAAGPLGNGYYLDVINGTMYDTWNLYYDDGCIFSVQEKDYGYAILLSRKECVKDAIDYIASPG